MTSERDREPADGEFGLIAQLAPFLAGDGEGLPVGSGDDAAVLDLDGRLVCIAVDVVVEDVHFRRDLSAPEDVGWKAVAVNCSDLAAMGSRPTAAVVGLCRPAGVPVVEVERLYAGMEEACQRWGLRLVGGDTVAAGALALSVTVLGEVPGGRPVRRSGARPGDALVVAGSLGAAAAALAAADAGGGAAGGGAAGGGAAGGGAAGGGAAGGGAAGGGAAGGGAAGAAGALLGAHRRPAALVAAGLALAAGGASAMIDVSDGLGADLGHLCAASNVRARVDASALPVAAGVAEVAQRLGRDPLEFACAGGEDFALLAAVPAGEAGALAAAAGEADGVPAAVVGEILEPGEPPAAVLVLPDGSERDLGGLGYDHYGG